MQTVVVTYRPVDDQADHNQHLVEQVFAELADADPGGIRYATLRLADGTFIHIAQIEQESSPLGDITAFGRFQEGIVERCEPGRGPNPQPAELIGSYRVFPQGG